MKRTIVVKINVNDDEQYAKVVAAVAKAANRTSTEILAIAWTDMGERTARRVDALMPSSLGSLEKLKVGIGKFAGQPGRM